jgi:hypothetical protein
MSHQTMNYIALFAIVSLTAGFGCVLLDIYLRPRKLLYPKSNNLFVHAASRRIARNARQASVSRPQPRREVRY